MNTKVFFTAEDLEKIKKAVTEAERSTSGEIITCFAERSDTYETALWRCFAVISSIAGLIAYLYCKIFTYWNPAGFYWGFLILPLGAFMIAVILYSIAPIRRIFAGNEALETHVRQAAHENFVKHEVFRTKDRTGILIYISFFEKKVHILADAGIADKLKDRDWKQVVSIITGKIKQDRLVEALVEGIAECGMLLQKSGCVKRSDDSDELDDGLRLREGHETK